MKKIISTVLMLIFIFSAAVSASADETKFSVDVKASSKNVKPGEEFTVEFMVTNITESAGIIGLDMAIEYDASLVQAVSKENIFPKQWEPAADFSSGFAVDENNKQTGIWEQRLLYDGDAVDSSISVVKDGELGVKVTFKALDNVEGVAKIGVKTGDDLIAVANNDFLDNIFGSSEPVRINVSNTVVTEAPTQATTQTDQTASEETHQDGSTAAETGATDDISGTSSGSTETDADTEGSSDVADVSDTDADVSQTESGTDAAAETTENSDNNSKKTIAIIAVIVLALIAVAAILAIKKFKKNTNDDNPVNPG